jgi:glucosamine-6-phosphate deaminase
MKPEIWRFQNANSLYYGLVDCIGTETTRIKDSGRDPVVTLPTGNTMIPFYKIAAEQEEKLKIQNWICFGLDEYFPIDPTLIRYSFKHYLEEKFLSRLTTPPKATHFFDYHSENFLIECEHYETKIKEAGGLDLAILGIGTNGHIAFNEPGSEFFSRTRAVSLHPQTLMANFKGKAPFTHALTMGIGTILEAKKIIVVALGKNKAQCVKSSLKEIQTRTLPASALQSHPNVTWFIDQEAASFI